MRQSALCRTGTFRWSIRGRLNYLVIPKRNCSTSPSLNLFIRTIATCCSTGSGNGSAGRGPLPLFIPVTSKGRDSQVGRTECCCHHLGRPSCHTELRIRYHRPQAHGGGNQGERGTIRQFFKTTLDCVFITTPDGKWIDFNDAAVEMFGYTGGKILTCLSLRSTYKSRRTSRVPVCGRGRIYQRAPHC